MYKDKSAKNVGCTYGEGGKRLKHGLERRVKVIKMYLEGVEIRFYREIRGRILMIYWIRHFAQLIRKEIRRRPIPNTQEPERHCDC